MEEQPPDEPSNPRCDRWLQALLGALGEPAALLDAHGLLVAGAPRFELAVRALGGEPPAPGRAVDLTPDGEGPSLEQRLLASLAEGTDIAIPLRGTFAAAAHWRLVGRPVDVAGHRRDGLLVRLSPGPSDESADRAERLLQLGESSTAGPVCGGVDRIRLVEWHAARPDIVIHRSLSLAPTADVPRSNASEELIDADDARRLRERVNHAVRSGEHDLLIDYRVVDAAGASSQEGGCWREALVQLDASGGVDAARLSGVSIDVTEIIAARRRFAEVHTSFQRLFALTPDGLVVSTLDTDGTARILEVNPALARMLGMEAREIEGRDFGSLVPADLAGALHAQLASLFRRGELRYELSVNAANGDVVTFEASSRLFDSNGRPRVLTVLRDLAWQRREEERIALSDRYFRTIADAIPQIVWTADAQGISEYINASWGAYTGMSPRIGTGEGWVAVVHPDDQPGMFAEWTESLRERRPFEHENRMRRADGAWRWFLHRGQPVLRADGSVERWIGTSTDIHAIKTGEAELRQREAWLGQVVDTIPHMVWTADARGVLEYQSRRLVEAVGEQPVQDDWLPWAGLFHADDLPRARSSWRQMLESGQPSGDELRIRMRDGAFRWFVVAAAPLLDAQGAVVRWIGTWTDIDARKQAEARLQESDRRKDEFLAMLSHELRNPLAPIRNGLELLVRAPPGSSSWQRAHDILRRQTDQLTRLVDDLLDITRINRGKIPLQPARMDLAEVVARCVEDHRLLFERADVRLDYTPPGRPLWMQGDAIRIAQALGNLLRNAAKFTPAGGWTRVQLAPGNDHAALAVEDNGAGIDAVLMSRLFEPFAQGEAGLDRRQGGLGLGLALVRGLVELHGGSVSAASEGPGRGSRFTVTLPTIDPATTSPQADREPAAKACRRVLIVEDNADAAECISTLLELQGYEALVATTGTDGVRVALAQRPDVVLCDIGLPGLDGFQVAAALRRDPSLAATRLYALSGYAAPEDVRRAREAGFEGLIPKPAELARILAAVEAAPRAGV